jgi:hypothetical protein
MAIGLEEVISQLSPQTVESIFPLAIKLMDSKKAGDVVLI